MSTSAYGRRSVQAGIRPRFFIGFGLVVSVIALVGGLTDIIGHITYQLSDYDNTFTPWHAILYGGLLGIMIVWIGGTFVNFSLDYHPWAEEKADRLKRKRMAWPIYFWHKLWISVPEGMELGLLGAIIIVLGMGGDITWHTLFGFEIGMEVIVSPSHILLILGLTLSSTGPLAYAWKHWDKPSLMQKIVIAFAAAFTLSWLWYYTNDSHPLVQVRYIALPFVGSVEHPFLPGQVVIASFFVASAVLMSVTMALAKRFTLLPGTFSLICWIGGAFLSVVQLEGEYVRLFLIGGAFMDVLYLLLRPLNTWRRTLAFSFFAPVVLWLSFTIGVEQTSGTILRIHGITGFPLLGGFFGSLTVGLSWVLAESLVRRTIGAGQLEEPEKPKRKPKRGEEYFDEEEVIFEGTSEQEVPTFEDLLSSRASLGD